ncbi:cell division protein ZipA C-terminal FtsZ-binding domain-containing protein [Billgrantia endophytica]|uniref:Cell division protein ZipA n=1 Tax=Billgrantia endophytica TaxID=2033802 RepID=A0A2N7U4J1_9GAMM|nr:cell division protein ZipA C-terminal FtsZ-binding domain-containing protein [Halomonas endophytica]PMR75351.1 hypothetical protein C1H69_10545 [Halomonas endophytica]
MDPVIGSLLLAGVTLFFALVCLAYFIVRYSRNSSHQKTRLDAAEGVPEAPSDPPEKPSGAPFQQPGTPATHQFKTVTGKDVQQCMFVVLDWPGLDTNRRLAKLLAENNAQYDSRLGVYRVRDPQAGYKLTIANSSPPGTLPPLHEGGDQPIVNGVSILVHFISKRRVARNPDTLIRFTESVASIGGQILDADRQVLSKDALDELRQNAL